MTLPEGTLKYKIGPWYLKSFPLRNGRFLAMGTTAGWPKTFFDFLDHDAYFASGRTPGLACLRLETKLGVLQCRKH